MKDMRGVPVQVGDVIVYGKSSRYEPIKLGTVISVEGREIEVLGKGNIKTGKLTLGSRVLVLPDNYLENVD